MYFFNFRSPVRYPISYIEKIIPMLLCLFFIFLTLVFHKRICSSKKLDRSLRILMFLLLLTSLITEYSLRYIQVGINRRSLPLHLCTIAAILSLVFIITNSKKLFSFLFSGCIPGAALAIIGPGIGRASNHIQYYTFMMLHILVIVVPIYYYIIYDYRINLKSHLKVMLLLQICALFVGVANDYFGTFYWYITYTRNMFAGTTLAFLGSGPVYFLHFEFLTLLMFTLWFLVYRVFNYLYSKYVK